MARAGAFYQDHPDGYTLFGLEGDAPEDMIPSVGPAADALRAEIDRDKAARMTAQADPSGAGGAGNAPETTARDFGPQGMGGAAPVAAVGGGTVGGGGEQLAPGGDVVAQEAPLPSAPVVQHTPLPGGPIRAPAPGAQPAAVAPEPAPTVPLISDESAAAYEYINRPTGGGFTPSRPAGWVPTSQSMQVTEALPPDVAMGEMGRAVGRFEDEDPARRARAQEQAAALDAEAMARQAEADRIREDAAHQAAFRREVQAEYERRVAGVNEQRRAVAERKVDPQRFFSENGTLGNILLALGAGLTAGGGGDGFAFIDRLIDRDIAEQQRQIQEQGAEADNALADLMRRYGYDIEEASQTLAIMQAQAAASEGQALAASANSGEIIGRYQAWADAQRAALAEREDKLRREMVGKAQSSLAQKWDPGQVGGYSAPRAPTLDEKIARAKRFPGLTPEQQASYVAGGVAQVGKSEESRFIIGRGADGQPLEVRARNKEHADRIATAWENTQAAERLLGTYIEGLTDPSKRDDPEFEGRFQQARRAQVAAMASGDGTQAPSDDEYNRAEQAFPEAERFGVFGPGASLGNVRAEKRNRVAAATARAELQERRRKLEDKMATASAGRAPQGARPVAPPPRGKD